MALPSTRTKREVATPSLGVYFYFSEDAGTGFFLPAGEFRHAEWTGLDREVLAVVMATATYAFEPLD